MEWMERFPSTMSRSRESGGVVMAGTAGILRYASFHPSWHRLDGFPTTVTPPAPNTSPRGPSRRTIYQRVLNNRNDASGVHATAGSGSAVSSASRDLCAGHACRLTDGNRQGP